MDDRTLQFKIDESLFTHTKLRKENETLDRDIKLSPLNLTLWHQKSSRFEVSNT